MPRWISLWFWLCASFLCSHITLADTPALKPDHWQWPKALWQQQKNPFRPWPHTKTTHPLSTPKVAVLHFFYQRAAALQATLQHSKLCKPNTLTWQINPTLKQIVAWGSPQQLRCLAHLIKKIDEPQPTVLIQARIITIDQQYARKLGIMVNGPQGVLRYPFSRVATHWFEIQLQALLQQGHAQLMATPQLITLNNQSATIESGDEIPYQEKTGQGNTSVTFKKAVISLNVTPQCVPGNNVLLRLAVSQDTVGSLSVNGIPTIRTQKIASQVLLHNQQTLVLGGIVQQQQSQSLEAIPGMHRIPLLGHLFQHQTRARQQKQLWVLLTPKRLTLPH